MRGTGSLRTAKLLLLVAVALPLGLVSQANAQVFTPAEAAHYAARAVTVTGTVSVLRDSAPWTISAGDSVQVQQMILTGPDGHAVFQLSDGSNFEVFPNSQVLFRAIPGNWRDLIDVILGRIRVQIEHLTGPNPNRVRTPTAVISVRGTTFEVSVDELGEVTQVDVEEGAVEVQHALLPRDQTAIVKAGESIRVYRNEPIARNLLDKGTVFRQVMRALMDAMTTLATNPGRAGIPGGGPIGTGGGSVPGDSCKPGTPGCGGSAPPIKGPGVPPPIH